ncbi:penicillin-binding protein 2 [Candidatus Saccharibacteria bacterium]|nr:penicillin-binding protein 2 [Candidatus Saccharibacteria bacterium]
MAEDRIKFLKLGLYFVAGVIMVRLFFVQIIQNKMWVAKAEEQHTMENKILAKRGEIYMMDGSEPVAVVMNEKVYTVVVDPMAADEEELRGLIFGEDMKENLVASEEEVFRDRTRRYFLVARNVGTQKAKQIREAEPAGVWLKEGTKRVYPEGELGARLLGFVNAEGEGQYGVEGALNKELKGTDGLLKTVADVNRVALSIGNDNVKIPAKDGEDVVLTIDRNVQNNVERILKEKMEEFGKDQASAVVMNPNTGEILAMANLPGYDPANYAEVESADVFINRVTEDPYEPASVCKAFTFATGVDLGVLGPETTYYNNGYEVIDGWKINNASQYDSLLGPTSIQKALNWSLNTGSIYALKLIGGDANRITEEGRKKLYEYYTEKFGLGKETGVELYENLGLIGDPVEGDGRDSLYANMTFGQNMLVTMMQVISGYNTLVNGGKKVTPSVVEGEMVGGELVKKERGEGEQVISEETSRVMREMLWGTRTTYRANGTDPAGYYIGGKTGTAQVIRDGKYSMDEWVATYVGFGGTEGELPEYTVMVRIWKDGETTSAETYALPIFSEISNYMINYLKLRPKQE